MKIDQIFLLLWKNYLIRKRHHMLFGLFFLWPVFVFMLLYTVRDNIDTEYNPSCQFPARLMPHDGFLQFLQSYICSIDNRCESLDEYEEVPSYAGAKFTEVLDEIDTILNNKTILTAVDTMPQSIQFLKSMAEILTQSETKKMFIRGIKLDNLFDEEKVLEILEKKLPYEKKKFIKKLFGTSIKLSYIIGFLSPSNVKEIICSPEKLRQYLIFPTDEEANFISQELCQLGDEKSPALLNRLIKHLNFNGLLDVINNIITKLKDYNFKDDIIKAVRTITVFETWKQHIPMHYKLYKWIPETLQLITDFNTNDTNDFFNKLIQEIDLKFPTDESWNIVQKELYTLDKFQKLVKNISNKSDNENVQLFHTNKMNCSNGSQQCLQSSLYRMDVPQKLDAIFVVLRDTEHSVVKLLNQHLDKTSNKTSAFTENIFSHKTINMLFHFMAVFENIAKMTHYAVVTSNEMPERFFNVLENHNETIVEILRNINSNVYTMILKTLSELNFLESLVENFEYKKSANVICEKNTFEEIFRELDSQSLYNLICDNRTKHLINDIYDMFEFGKFETIIDNILLTFIKIFLSQPVIIQRNNITSFVQSVQRLHHYLLNSESVNKKFDWNKFGFADGWAQLMNSTQFQGKRVILGYFLSLVKHVGTNSLSYRVLKSHLENMEIVAKSIIQDLQDNSKISLSKIKNNKPQLLESFYLTIGDINRTLTILEYYDITKSYCNNEHSLELINYPLGSNKVLLKELVCQLMTSIRGKLDIQLLEQKRLRGKKSFNWTELNEILLRIYEFVDIPDNEKINEFESTGKFVKNFEKSWMENLSLNSAIEISIGLMCKILNLFESPILQIKSKSEWKYLETLAWSLSTIFNDIDSAADSIININHIGQYSELAENKSPFKIFLKTIFRITAAIIHDIDNIPEEKSPMTYIKLVYAHFKDEKNWPCSATHKQSEKSVLLFGDNDIINGIEQFFCSIEMIIKEWRKQPNLTRVYEVFKGNEVEDVPSFNWTYGYLKFRRLSQKFRIMFNLSVDVPLIKKQEPTNPSNNSIIDTVMTVFSEKSSYVPGLNMILNYIDLDIDSKVQIFHSNLTTKDILRSKREVNAYDKLLVTMKFLSLILTDGIDVIRQVFSRFPDKINLIEIMGFTDKTIPYMIRHKLSSILATVVNGLSDIDLENVIHKHTKSNLSFTCLDIFAEFYKYKIDLADEEYYALENFICSQDVQNFNIFLEFYLNTTTYLEMPISNYKLKILSLFGKLINYHQFLNAVMNDPFKINSPFEEIYFKKVFKTLSMLLETSNVSHAQKPDMEWSNYRVTLQGLSEVLNTAANVLKNYKQKNNILHIWDFFPTGYTSELLKFFEDHSVETISLLATFGALNSNSSSFEYIDYTMCELHFNSSFWRQSKNKFFLDQLCSLDTHNFLESITSEDYVKFILNRNAESLRNMKPVSNNFANFINVWINISESLNQPIIFESNILNATTWQNLPNDTQELLYNMEVSLMYDIYLIYSSNSQLNQNISEIHYLSKYHVFNTLVKILQTTKLWFDILSGGDIWQTLQQIFESSELSELLVFLENFPDFLIMLSDTFLNSEKFNLFTKKFMIGDVNVCNVNEYCNVPRYIEKPNILSIITNFCSNNLFNDANFSGDIRTLIFSKFFFTHESTHIDVEKLKNYSNNEILANETYVIEKFKKLQSEIFSMLKKGYKPLVMPSWLNAFKEKTLKNFNKQFDNKERKRILHLIISKFMKIVKDILEFLPKSNKTCSWCYTEAIEILNSQLQHHVIYNEILCEYRKMNISDIQEIIDAQMNWNGTIVMLKNFKFSDRNEEIDNFLLSFESTLHHIIDIAVNYDNRKLEKKSDKCLKDAINDIQNFSPTIYIKMIRGIIYYVQDNIEIKNYNDVFNRMQIDTFEPNWKSLKSIVKTSTVSDVDKLLPNAMININLLLDNQGNVSCAYLNCDIFYYASILNSRQGHNFLKYDSKIMEHISIADISKLLKEKLDMKLITQEILLWKKNVVHQLANTRLKYIVDELTIIVEGTSKMFDIVKKVDFQEISSLIIKSDVLQVVVDCLKNKTIDNIFTSMKHMIKDLNIFFEDTQTEWHFNLVVDILKSMKIFKYFQLLNIEFPLTEMFADWKILNKFLTEEVNISKRSVSILNQTNVDIPMIFLKESSKFNFNSTLCSEERVNSILNFEESELNSLEAVAILCSLNLSETIDIALAFVGNLQYGYVLHNVMNINIDTILKNANLTEHDKNMIFDNIGIITELLSVFKNKIMSKIDFTDITTDSKDTEVSVNGFLKSASEIVCGRQLLSDDSGDVYKAISSLRDKENATDPELESLPDYCQNIYKSVKEMNAGKIIWTYIKPLIRGRILYAPESVAIKKIMQLANKTFTEIDTLGGLVMSLQRTVLELSQLSGMETNLKDLQMVMASDAMKAAMKVITKDNRSSDAFKFDFSDISLSIKHSHKLLRMIQQLNNFIKCVLTDRIIGFKSEDELEQEARKLMNTHDFLAGVVFVNSIGCVNCPDNESLLNDITYKIRMDIDYVPSTKRLKNQFWIPGPESSFVEDLRYLRGFIQLQDAIDRAIIQVKSGVTTNWKTVSQQMPYPCWRYKAFQSTLYESQGLIVSFFFALMICVGSIVHYTVWERESENETIMSIMGLKKYNNVIAWFITSFVELTIVSTIIFSILVYGKILPKSDPTVVFALLLDYAFSILTFCYMISTAFSSASLAAVAVVIAFLLTYMPYIIVIAMESNLDFSYNLILCLSMSTSFSYGCLYAARREVQGLGLQWQTIWDEPNPGNQLSLGLIMIIIAFDTILYGIIAYFIAKYINPGMKANKNNIMLKDQEIGVQFESVKKIYRTRRTECVAIDNFSLNLRKGEVTSLLGRNGAGKTTLIKILTGMIRPTSGNIYVNGNKEKDLNIGICPQENILIETLTPLEHMVFYARLKKRTITKDIQVNMNTLLTTLELGKKEREPVSRLSGGTKRRLCVALAFLCSPQVVILDEPCAGVDPASRRKIWALIEQYKINTTILLSTHHLDEAEMLSDTIVIMNRGNILYNGSPIILKTKFGRGYFINVTFSNEESQEMVESNVDHFKHLIESVTSNAKFNRSLNSIIINLPFCERHGGPTDVASAIEILENNKENLGFSHIFLKCDTLENIFVDLCAQAEDKKSSLEKNKIRIPNFNYNINHHHNNDFISVIPSAINPSPFKQIAALLKKKIWHFLKDWRAPFAALVLPTMFVAIAMGFSMIRPPAGGEPALVLSPELYKTQTSYFYAIDNHTDIFLQNISLQFHQRFNNNYLRPQKVFQNNTKNCDCVEGQQICERILKDSSNGLLQTVSGRPTVDWIIDTFQEHIEKRYGGWTLSHWKEEPLFVVWYNNKGHHSLPAYLNALNNAVLESLGIHAQMTVLNHPLKLSSDQLNRMTIVQHVADVGVALVLLIAFNLVAAHGAKELVRERLSQEKRILYLAGVHPITYWISAFIWDTFMFLTSIALAVGVFEMYGLPAYIARDNLLGICVLLVLFSWASVPFTHLFEKLFNDSSLPNMILFCINTFIGVACLAAILVLDILIQSQTVKDIRKLLHNIWLIFPQYALGDAIVKISTNDITAELLEKFNMNTYKSPLGWDLIGRHYVYLFMAGVVLHVINILVECEIFFNCRSKQISTKIENEDEDVVKERHRVEKETSDVIKTIQLSKQYRSVYGKNVAVQNLSLGIQTGTCFGLVGINGAGKSTIFKMLTTEIAPTSGKIVLHNKQISGQNLPAGQISYCPQTNSLDGFLTPYQCLTIHAEVCGLRHISSIVNQVLQRFDLLQYAHRRVSNLSGGNKRKLCAAISIISPASVILMDEPTSGMDPTSKALITGIIHEIIQTQRVVLLTSHSIADLENLCNRMGILVNARLRSIGSIPSLKQKFGESYIIFIRFERSVEIEKLNDAIRKYLNCAHILSQQLLSVRLILKRHEMKLSTIFRKVKEFSTALNAADYSFTQSSMDQMLANFTDIEENMITNCHGQSDTVQRNLSTTENIHMDTMKKN